MPEDPDRGGACPRPEPPREARVRRRIEAAPHVVDVLLLDPQAIAECKVSDGKRCRVHVFEPCEGGRRVALARLARSEQSRADIEKAAARWRH